MTRSSTVCTRVSYLLQELNKAYEFRRYSCMCLPLENRMRGITAIYIVNIKPKRLIVFTVSLVQTLCCAVAHAAF